MRKTPIKFNFNNKKYNVAINSYVPGGGYVKVLSDYPAEYVTDNKNGDAIKIIVECNLQSCENGRIYALYYNINTQQFDSNYTLN